MNQITVLSVKATYGFTEDIIYPVVLKDDKNYVLVDCGYVGSLMYIEEALRENGIRPDLITHIILTHHDHDHIGAVAEFKRKYPTVKTMASSVEAPYMSGTLKSLRLEQAELLQEILPPEQQRFGIEFCELLRKVEPFKVDYMLRPGEVLDFCGGCIVLDTQGHTPGHISLYMPKFDTLVSGDAIAIEHGRPVIANIQFALNQENATSSFQQLMSLNPKKIICYHGGVLMDGEGHVQNEDNGI